MNIENRLIQCDCCGKRLPIGEFSRLRETATPERDMIMLQLRCPACTKSFECRVDRFRSDYEKDRDALEDSLNTAEETLNLKKMKRKYGKLRLDTDPIIPWWRLQSMTANFERLSERSEKLYRRLIALPETSESIQFKEPIAVYRSRYESLRKEQKDELLRRKHRSLTVKVTVSVLFCLLVIGALLGVHLTPRTLTDSDSGIEIELDAGDFSLLEKYTVGIEVLQKAASSSEHETVSTLLRGECNRFTLYDIFLTSGGKETQPKAPVYVTVPFDPSLRRENLTVYYIAPDGIPTELDCTVSSVNNTVTFSTDHFSLYAIAEKPFTVTFDTAGGEAVEPQRLLWGGLAEEPPVPMREGYTFLHWADASSGAVWEFSSVPVAHDVTLVAMWAANGYRVTLDPCGGGLSQTELGVTYGAAYGALPTPVRAGFTFVSWALDGMHVDASASCTTARDHTLVAVWTPAVYTVTLDPLGGSCDVGSIQVSYEGNYGELPVPVRQGYTFGGWQWDGENMISASVCHTPSDHTLTALWIPNRYLVSFDPRGGSVTVSHLTVEFNGKYGTLPVPVREGYEFLGWGYGEKVLTLESICTLASDHTLTAVWEKKRFSLSFDTNGGGAVAAQSVRFLDAYGELPVPVREGYTFSHWTLDGNVIGSDTLCATPSDHKLMAVWTANRYTVTFDGYDGRLEVIFDGKYGTLPTPLREGYTFSHWTLGGNAIGSDTLCATPSDHKLTAVWTANRYTVSFETDGGTQLDSITVTFGEVYGTLPIPEKEGFHFSFWRLGGNVIYSDTVCETAGDHTLTVYWIGNRYTLSFDGNGADAALPSQKVQFGKTYGELPLPVRTGYIFSHWSLGDVAVGSSTYCTTAGDHTLVANWTVAGFTLSFDTCGGNELSPQYVQFGAAYGALPIPVREGYTFAGWYFGNIAVPADTVCKIADDHTLAAAWTANSYEVRFDAAGGEAVDKVLTVEFGSAYGSLPHPSREGYLFGGWQLDGVDVSYDTVCSTRSDHTLTARWIARLYFITYELGGGEKKPGDSYPSYYSVESDVSIPSPVYPTYPDYNRFVGWYEDEACTVAFVNDLAENPRDVTLYAKWDLCYVYNSIDSSPWRVQNVSSGGINYTRIIFDWSRETELDLLTHKSRDTAGTYRYNNIDVYNSVTELIFIGGGKTFQNFRMFLCFFEEGNGITLRFDGFSFVSNESTAIAEFDSTGYRVTISVDGNCSIGTSYAGGNVISLPSGTLSVSGVGDLTLRAGDGADGSSYGESGADGGVALLTEMLVLMLDGKLSLYGGDGGDGYVGANGADGNPNYNADGSDRDSVGNGADGGNGGDGQTGGSGGDGGAPYNADIVLLLTRGALYAYGGDAGNGADGGDGGDGGRGQESGLWGGTGGNGGNAGSGGDGGDSGTAGKALGFVTEINGRLYAYNGKIGKAGSGGTAGAVGPAGTHSHLRDPGKYWGTWGDAGSDGSSGKDGNDGTVFY